MTYGTKTNMRTAMTTDNAKEYLIHHMTSSIDIGFLDDDVHRELEACITLAQTIKDPFTRYLLLEVLDNMTKERRHKNVTKHTMPIL